MLKSSKNQLGQNLAARFRPHRAEELLQFWANLSDVGTNNFSDEVESLKKYDPEIFGELIASLKPSDSQGLGEAGEDFFRSIWGIREHLRAAWQATDLRVREWYIHELRRLYAQHREVFSRPAKAAALPSSSEEH